MEGKFISDINPLYPKANGQLALSQLKEDLKSIELYLEHTEDNGEPSTIPDETSTDPSVSTASLNN